MTFLLREVDGIRHFLPFPTCKSSQSGPIRGGQMGTGEQRSGSEGWPSQSLR
jgi:hypothetical protein